MPCSYPLLSDANGIKTSELDVALAAGLRYSAIEAQFPVPRRGDPHRCQCLFKDWIVVVVLMRLLTDEEMRLLHMRS